MASVMDPRSSAELLKAFAHATRLMILVELVAGPKCVTDMEDLLPARQANISQHLAVLRHMRLVDYAQDGALRCYYLSRPRLVRRLLALVAHDEPVTSRTADEIKAAKRRLAAIERTDDASHAAQAQARPAATRRTAGKRRAALTRRAVQAGPTGRLPS